MTEGVPLYEALRRHSRCTKEIVQRHDYDPRLTVILRDAQDRQQAVVVTDEADLHAAMAVLTEHLACAEGARP